MQNLKAIDSTNKPARSRRRLASKAAHLAVAPISGGQTAADSLAHVGNSDLKPTAKRDIATPRF